MNAEYLKSKHSAALNYADYLATDPEKAQPWNEIYAQTGLADEQRQLVSGFSRTIKALCVSGIWCGDCVQQGPLLQHIAEANPCIDLKWVDRDEHLDLAEQLKICAGLRVPVLLLLAEDYELVSIYGDRTLTRYRAIAERKLGPSCPLPGAPVPTEELLGTLQDWLDEFERVHLLLRLSARLRERHSD